MIIDKDRDYTNTAFEFGNSQCYFRNARQTGLLDRVDVLLQRTVGCVRAVVVNIDELAEKERFRERYMRMSRCGGCAMVASSGMVPALCVPSPSLAAWAYANMRRSSLIRVPV